MSVNIYTAKYNQKAFADSVTDSETGTDKNNLFDQNMNTYWQADNNTGTKEIVIDTGVTTISVNRLALWIPNYASCALGMDFTLYQSTDKVNWGSNIGTWAFSPGSGVNMGDGALVVFTELAAAATNRYLKIAISDIATVPKISQILLLTKRELSYGAEYPITDTPSYPVVRTEMQDGRDIVKLLGQNPVTNKYRSFRLINSTMKTAFDNVIADLLGGANLFVYNAAFGVFTLCMLTGYNCEETAYQFYDATLEFKSVPYITEGEYF